MSSRYELKLDEQGLPLPVRWHPILSPLSMVFGIIFDLGVEILGVQLAIDALTWWTLLRAALVGLAIGVVVPSIGFAFGVKRLNKKIRALRDDAQRQQVRASRPATKGSLARLMILLAMGVMLAAPLATADVSTDADCTLIMNGRDITERPASKSDPIRIDYGDAVNLDAFCDQKVYSLRIVGKVLGFDAAERNYEAPGGSKVFRESTTPGDWEQASTGLWKGEAFGYDQDGSVVVRADYWIHVQGDTPVAAPAGLASAAATVVGATGMVWISVAIILEGVDVANELRGFRAKLKIAKAL